MEFFLFDFLSDVLSGFVMTVINFLVDCTGSYGWSLVLLAVLIKVALYGPTKHQFESMKNMQKVQPEMQRIQEKYKDDQEKMQKELMRLYKENNVNPLGGCLPMLVQLPILWAIWRAIIQYQTIFESSYFLWLGTPLAYKYPDLFSKSLAGQDAVLLLVYGFSMYLTQKSTTPASDPKMAKQQSSMGLIMTIFFTYMMWQWKMPCALIVYWLVFNILSIIQQIMIMSGKPEAKPTTEKGSAGSPAT